MKKILFIIMTVFIFTDTAKASEWQEDILTGSNVETEYRYLFYKETIKGEYTSIGKNSKYEYENINDITFGTYTDYQINCVEDQKYDIKKITKYNYQEILPVEYITINNLSDLELDINNIELLENNNLVTYEFYSCTDCVNDNYTINPKGSLIIKLEYPVKIKKLYLILEFFDNGNKGSYELIYSNKPENNNNNLVSYIKGNVDTINYIYNTKFKLYQNYTQPQIGYDIEIDEFTKILSKEEGCIKREIFTYHYNIIKEYYDNNYYKDINGLINLNKEEKNEYKKDLENYKVFYRYKDNPEEAKKDIEITNTKLISNNTNLVKTGTNPEKNYDYLILYVLSLILISLILIKYIKIMSNENYN